MKTRSAALALLIVCISFPTHARTRSADPKPALRPHSAPSAEFTTRGDAPPELLRATAGATTTVLYQASFDTGASCTSQGWTAVDMTAEPDAYFHVDDFAGLPAPYAPLDGTKSLWCGAREQATGPVCNYATLPGYGNGWNQAFCTTACIPVSSDGLLDVSFLARFDSEPAYDATYLHYNLDCGGNPDTWVQLDGGIGVWDGAFSASINQAYDIGSAGPVRVRFAFWSDGAWSDEDGLWDTAGAVVIDNLAVEGVPLEDFEDEAVGATVATDWKNCNPPGYGVAMGLFNGAAQVQEDPCNKDLSCVWAALVGSTANYACGGFPAQVAVPFMNARGQYLWNEILSPDIPFIGTGNSVLLQFDIYRDLPLDNLVFYTWEIRSIPASGCPTRWADREYVYYGAQKDWITSLNPVGDLLDPDAAAVSVGISVMDMCSVWCGYVGTGSCHSHAPMFDNVKLYRVDTSGPQWSIRDIDQFQDTFSTDGTPTGTARADMANDVTQDSHVNSIMPGDSAMVHVSDPAAGLATDNGRAAVYAYFSVLPKNQPGKSGAGIQAPEMRNGGPRYPVVGTWTDASGAEWTRVQLDSCVVNGTALYDDFCVDLNDNLFTPGDTIRFFYGAMSTDASESYAYGSNLGATGPDREAAAANPSEFSVLPASGSFTDILYVDGMDGRGAQPYWDSAFQAFGLRVDRYDVRGPSSGVANRPGARANVVQLSTAYRVILWDTGDLSTTLGDGSGTPEKSDDWDLLGEFLANLSSNGGVYLCGDDLPEQLSSANSVSALTFKSTWVPFLLTTGNHRPLYGISPVGEAVPGGMFASDASMILYGGCPLVNDFDVIQPQGTTLNHMTYGPGDAMSTNGAVVGNVFGDARVVMGGFSFIYIRDDDTNGRADRADFLHDVLVYLAHGPGQPTPATSPGVNSLSQNYPNPFNPQTTIAFSLKERGVVRLSVYSVAGQWVRTLANEAFDAGTHTRVWDGRNDAGSPVASGVYFYRIAAKDFAQTRKMVLLK